MRDFVLKRIACILLPFISLFGIYVIVHGHTSAGGTFAGGILLGLSIIAYSTVYGTDKAREKLPEKVLIWIESYGTLWYIILGLVGIVNGVPFLANKLAGISLGVPGELTSGGLIPLLGLGVGFRVASTVVTLFFTIDEESSEQVVR